MAGPLHPLCEEDNLILNFKINGAEAAGKLATYKRHTLRQRCIWVSRYEAFGGFCCGKLELTRADISYQLRINLT